MVLSGGSVLGSGAGTLSTQCGWSPASLGVTESMHNLHLYHHSHSFHEPIEWWQWWQERGWLVCTGLVIVSTWLMKILLCWGHPLVSVHMGHNNFLFTHLESWVYLLFLRPLDTNFLIIFLPRFWPSSQTIDHSSWICIWSSIWSLLPSKVKNRVHLKFCPLEDFPHHSPPGPSQKGAEVLQLSTFRWCLHIVQSLSQPPYCRNFPWGHMCRLGGRDNVEGMGTTDIWATSSCKPNLICAASMWWWSAQIYLAW